MKDVEKLFCSSASRFSPYAPIEPPDRIAERLKIPEERIIKLDANENPFGAAPEVLSALGQGKNYHIYPDPAQTRLRRAIAKHIDREPETIAAGSGADEILDLACRLFLEPGERVVSFTPTFSYYSHVVALNKGRFDGYPREKDFSISLSRAKSVDLKGVKLVILCSPNNPTGNLVEEPVLDYFLEKNLVVLVDEAYAEFAGTTFRDKLDDHENLIIAGTFSKCFGLAGLRAGYGVMSEKTAEGIMKIKPPFSVNMAAETAVETCLKNIDLYQRQIREISRIRNWFYKRLRKIERLEPFPSRANFILCRAIDFDARQLFLHLESRGILTRHFNTDQLSNYIRFSIGTFPQMETLIRELDNILG